MCNTTDKDNESILTILREEAENALDIPDLLSFDKGFLSGELQAEYLLSSCNARWMRRGDVEDNPAFLQLVPYVFFEYAFNDQHTSVLSYSRGKSGGEDRLHDLYSVGIGGHVNAQDIVLGADNCTDILTTLRRAMIREILEEIEPPPIQTEVEQFGDDGQCFPGRIHGLIYDPSNEVGQVHLGIACKLQAAGPLARPNEGCVKNLDWRGPKILLNNYQLETWSEILLRSVYVD